MGSLTSWDGFELHIGMGKITFRDALESSYPQGSNTYFLGWVVPRLMIFQMALSNHMIYMVFLKIPLAVLYSETYILGWVAPALSG